MTDPVPFRPLTPGTQPPYDAPGYLGTIKRHPKQKPHPAAPHHHGDHRPELLRQRIFRRSPTSAMTAGKPALGERIIVAGTITDEDGRPVPHTMIEIWQANATGRYDHPARPARRAARSEFPRRGPGIHRRGRPLPVPDDPARRLSVAQPPQRLAAEPHPFLAISDRPSRRAW